MVLTSANRAKPWRQKVNDLRARAEPWLGPLGILLVVVLAAVGAYRVIAHSSDFRGFYERARALMTTGRVTVGLLWARDRMAVRGGMLLAAAAFAKIVPGLFLLIPAVFGRLKGTAIGLTLSILLTVAALGAAFGFRESADWTGKWISHVADQHTGERMLDQRRALQYNNQTLLASLARTFGDFHPIAVPGSTSLANLPIRVISRANMAIQLILLAAGIVAVIYARRLPAESAWAALYALIALLILLLSPLVWTHYFLWWLPALVYLSKRKRKRLFVAFGVTAAAALSSATLRGLGAHLLLTLVLYVLVLHSIFKSACGASAHEATPL